MTETIVAQAANKKRCSREQADEGGSLIRIDAGGALQIGPQSAGASPGPVCYDRGGTEPNPCICWWTALG